MKKHNRPNKLLLSVSKVRDLSADQLERVIGGACPNASCNDSDGGGGGGVKPCPHTLRP